MDSLNPELIGSTHPSAPSGIGLNPAVSANPPGPTFLKTMFAFIRKYEVIEICSTAIVIGMLVYWFIAAPVLTGSILFGAITFPILMSLYEENVAHPQP